jgi:hypothetical protein
MKYRWVERDPTFPQWAGDFDTPEQAKEYAMEWRNEGGLMTPEHSEIFLISIEDNRADIYKENGCPVTLGHLLW